MKAQMGNMRYGMYLGLREGIIPIGHEMSGMESDTEVIPAIFWCCLSPLTVLS